jgi:hypothetical protein
MQLLSETYINVMNIYYLQQIIYFIYILFYDAFSSKDSWMIIWNVSDELKRMWKEAVVA